MDLISNSTNQAFKGREKRRSSLATSQLLLLQSRRKWGIMYMLATLSGIFIPIGLFTPIVDRDLILTLAIKNTPLLAATFLFITGLYVLNDLVDADLDRSSGKKRPISSGQVTDVQARIFVIMTNATGIFLALMTYNPYSITIALIIIGIGLMYSAPKICLKDRFVAKTASIAAASMLCLLLGSSYTFNSTGMIIHGVKYHTSDIGVAILISAYGALMSGCIIFITSLLNDLGDVDGDAAFGRRTIPVVIGRKSAVKLTIIIAITMVFISSIAFCLLPYKIGIIGPLLVSLVAAFSALKMAKVLRHLTDCKFIRDQHKKSIQWHLMLQSALIVGSLLFWVRF